MTCREKLTLEHPEYISDEYFGGCFNCPPGYGYLDYPEYCGSDDPDRCAQCWDREIPGTETVVTIKEEKETMTNTTNTTTKKTKVELLNEIAELKKELENLDKYRQYENIADELASIRDAFMAKGFTREEAISFIFNAMNSMANNTDRNKYPYAAI